jgi:phage terminase small subunit
MHETLENTDIPQQPAVYTDTHTEIRRHPTLSGLTGRQENFARAYAECGVALDAYRAAYEADGSSRATARVNAYRLLKNPRVASRIRELQDSAAERSGRSAAALIRELEEMASADLNELMQLVVGSCRHCWGERGAYQWRDDMEYAHAWDEAVATKKPLPSMAGGFGYQFERDPNLECVSCDGAGIQRVRFTNTADLSPGVRRLFRGIELFPDGSIKRVLLHDQMAARIELHRLKGLHIDRSVSVTAHVPVPALKDMSPAEALDFLESLKPTAPALPQPERAAISAQFDVVDAETA